MSQSNCSDRQISDGSRILELVVKPVAVNDVEVSQDGHDAPGREVEHDADRVVGVHQRAEPPGCVQGEDCNIGK